MGDFAAAAACLAGVLVTSGVPVMGLIAWLIVRIGLEALAVCASSALALSGARWMGLARLAALLGVLAFDLYALYINVQLLLFLELRAKVSPSSHQFMAAAQRAALAELEPGGWGSCCRRHLVVALLLDPDIKDILHSAGVPVQRLEAEVLTAAGLDIVGERERKLLQIGLPLGADLQATVRDASVLQEKAGDERLRADHLLLALCAGGELDVALARGGCAHYVVDVGVVRQYLNAMQARSRASRPPEGAPGATVLGCLPLEETIMAWAGALAAVEVFLLFFVRNSKFLGILETFKGLVGPVCHVLGLLGIIGHRRARNQVREAAACLGTRWDAELDEAFNAVRREPEAAEWFRQLKRGADWTAVLWLWTLAELFLDVPIIGMTLAANNICGVYAGGLAGVTTASSALPSTLLHCSPEDLALIAGMGAMLALKAVACWAVLALWHEYSHGWTTTDLRGLALITPFSLLSDPVAKVLAGLPRWAQARLGVTEAVPLVM